MALMTRQQIGPWGCCRPLLSGGGWDFDETDHERDFRLMTYQLGRDLNLTYDPQRGWFNFVLYSEGPQSWHSALNATQRLRKSSRYAQEWIDRLQATDPSPTHMALVKNDEAPLLWNPCVFDDPESPSAVAGDRCGCLTTLYDPLTWMPVVKEHERTVGGDSERWKYWTFSPLSLPEGQVLERLIIDQEAGVMWLRNDRGELHFLPEKVAEGYEVGYGGSGPGKLAAMIEKIVDSDGHDVTPDTNQVTAHPHLKDWTSSPESKQTRELSLAQLEALRATGNAPA